LLTRRVLLEAAAVLLGFSAVAVAVTWPMAADLDDTIYGYPGDSTGSIAFIWSSAHENGYHLLGSTHVGLTGAPFGWEFSNALNIQWGLVFGPAVLISKVIGEIAAYNLIVLSGLVLSAASMYLLVRRIGVSPLVAAWSGLAYTIFPWHLEKAQGHVTFVHLEGFPLLVLAVLAWNRRPDWKRALLIASVMLILWTTAGYFGLIGLVAIAVLLTASAIVQQRSVGWWVAVRRLALAGGLSLAVPVLIRASALIGSGAEAVPGARDVGSLRTYGARPWEYFLPSYRNPWFGDDVGSFLIAHLHGSNFSETSLYVGWITLVLAGAFLVYAALRWRGLSSEQRFLTAVLPVLGIVAVIFSLPSPLSHSSVPGPSRILWEIAPQFRVPSRFVALVMTALIPLAALGLDAFTRLLWTRHRWGSVAAVALVFVVAVGTTLEFWVKRTTTDFDVTPVYYRAVENARGTLAEYPLAKAEQAVNSDYLFWQRKHHRPLVNGAATDSFAEAAGQSVLDPASPDTASELAALGVTTIVVRPTTYAFSGGKPAPERLDRGYRLIGRYPGETSVWRVVAKPAPALATFTNGFSFTEAPPGQPTSRWMISPTASVDLYAWRPGTYRATFGIASYGKPRLVRISGQGGARVLAVSGPRTVSIPVTLPKGRSRLDLFARPGPQLVPDGRRVTVYISNWRFKPIKRAEAAVKAIPQ
jgi:hypothetical protein